MSAARPERPPAARIRPALEGDIPAIHALLTELAQATGLADKFLSSAEDLCRYGFSQQPMFEVMLAERDGGIAGLCLYFYTYSSWRGSPGVYVQDLVVDPRSRSAGLGEALLRAAARGAKSRGATHLRLSVEAANAGAIRFYEKLGLRHAGSERIYEAGDAAFDALATES